MKDLIAFRHQIHKEPELSGMEKKTANRVLEIINQYAPSELITEIGGYGIAAIYQSGCDGPCLLIRCDMDAIPVDETSNKPYKSRRTGISHACGHDGHMAIALGICKLLSKTELTHGSVIVAFQPAEETGEGARAFLEDPKIKHLKPDLAIALHNMPAYPLNSVIIPSANFSSAVESVAINLEGKQCHASEPEKGINPSLAVAELIKEFNSLINTDQKSDSFRLLTPISIKVGKVAYGVSAGKAELHYTLRAWNDKELNFLKTKIKEISNTIAQEYGLVIHFSWKDYFPATLIDKEVSDFVESAANELNLEIIKKDIPFRFGEDFGWFTQKFPSCIFALGAGEDSPALHHSDYDFPDELIKTGCDIYRKIIDAILH